MLPIRRLRRAYEIARDALLGARHPSGHWVGQLCSSALATATATSALSVVLRQAAPQQYARERLEPLVHNATRWLVEHQNPDGGWGDTDKSPSNIATTMLVQAAFWLAGAAPTHPAVMDRAKHYVDSAGGLAALRNRYGKDKTFAVPILANAALAGLVQWGEVSPLPLELACLPGRVLGPLRLPVVSYAIPALVAIGLAQYFHRRPKNPLFRLLRGLAARPALEVLCRMQPPSGGFLEATPLTSFVVMSLAATGRAGHPVTRRGVDFLVASARSDGSWPIDTNLAHWITTLAINALADAGEDVGRLGCLDWLLACQHRDVHPMTQAAPGGWGWTDSSGAVPDADDTSAALLALAALRKTSTPEQAQRIDRAASLGLRWLLGLQNSDGGWPTFCRGWGNLPFDRSAADLTAHALRAIHAWASRPGAPADGRAARPAQHESPGTGPMRRRMDRAVQAGLGYLARQQRPDGSWIPLWFGNPYHPEQQDPVYGTARVLLAYRDVGLVDSGPARSGLAWLAAHQDPEGGWGGTAVSRPGCLSALSTVEQTAVAVEALLCTGSDPLSQPALAQGLAWLVQAAESGRLGEAAPIGLFFARLWYYEELYPLCFSVSALGRAVAGWTLAAWPDSPAWLSITPDSAG